MLIMTATRVHAVFRVPFQKFPQPLLICGGDYNGIALGWNCAPNATEFKIVCANGSRVPAEGAALFAIAGELVEAISTFG